MSPHHQHQDLGFSSGTTSPPLQASGLPPLPTQSREHTFGIPSWDQHSRRRRQPSSPQISPRTIIPPQPQPPSENSPTSHRATHPYHNWASPPSTPSPVPRYQHCPIRCPACARGTPCILSYRNISIADHRPRPASATAPELFVEDHGQCGVPDWHWQQERHQEQQHEDAFPNLGIYLDVNVIVTMTTADEATTTTTFRVDGFL